MHQQLLVQRRFLSSTTFGVHILDLHKFQFWGISIRWTAGTAKSTIWAFFLVFSTTIMSSLLCSIIWSIWMLKSQRILKNSFSVRGKDLCYYCFSGTLKPFFLNYKYLAAQSFPSSQVVSRLRPFWRRLGHSEIKLLFLSLLPILSLLLSLLPS